jgi:hypothetical protein
MGIFRGTSKVVNKFGGSLAKKGVNAISQAVSIKHEGMGRYIGEVGNTVVEASKSALDNVGQFADGTVESLYGLAKKDEKWKQQGWSNITDSTERTLKGLGSGIKYTVKSTGLTLKGLRHGNREEILCGLANIGKVVAVTTFAVGIIDIVDATDLVQAEEIDTRNDHLSGMVHPETGVPFLEKVVELPNGNVIEGTFPVFESEFSVIIAEEVYLESDNTHFKIANETLYQSLIQNPELAKELDLSHTDIQNLSRGISPDGYDWHHNEQPGVLQLVKEEIHQNTGHTGGREIWGGGSQFR